MKIKRKMFNIISAVLVSTAYISATKGYSYLLFGETKIPDELMK